MNNKFDFNMQQESIIKDRRFPMYLRAGAGTGKTYVLVEKILDIMSNDSSITLEDFIVITFTNKAANELKEQILSQLYEKWQHSNDPKIRKQIERYNLFEASTIHSFCEKIIRKYGNLKGIKSNFKIASFTENNTLIISKILNSYRNTPTLSNIPEYKMVDMIISFIKSVTNKGIEIDENFISKFKLDLHNNDFFNEFKKVFLEICFKSKNEINKLQREKNIISLNNLVPTANYLIQDKEIAKRVAKLYKYIFIDEVQDIDTIQFDLIKSMSDIGIKLFMIGDEKQSIYAFRGADTNNINRINTLIGTNNKNNTLSINYRTDPALLEIINSIFSSKFRFQNKRLNFPSQNLIAGKKTDGCNNPFEVVFDKPISEIINDVVSYSKIHNKNIGFGDIAVLCRRNHDLEMIGKNLKSAHIPVEVIGGSGFFKKLEIIDTFKILNAVIYKNVININEAEFTCYFRSLTQSSDSTPFKDFINEIGAVCRVLSIESILEFIYDRSHIFDYLRTKNQYQAISNLLKLKDKARDMVITQMIQPIQFLEYLNIMITSQKDEDEADILETDRKSGVVSVYSIHRAKGLKFPVVIIPNCDFNLTNFGPPPNILFDINDKNYVLGINKNYFNKNAEYIDLRYDEIHKNKIKEQLEEEIRILYVAMTRAENKLILSCKRTKTQVTNFIKAPTTSWIKWIIQSGEYNI